MKTQILLSIATLISMNTLPVMAEEVQPGQQNAQPCVQETVKTTNVKRSGIKHFFRDAERKLSLKTIDSSAVLDQQATPATTGDALLDYPSDNFIITD